MRRLGYATVAVLNAISSGARYGLDIMDATGLPSGTVYPTLTRMENRGLVSGSWESNTIALKEGRPRRRYYKLTAAGSAALSDALRYYGTLGDALPQGG